MVDLVPTTLMFPLMNPIHRSLDDKSPEFALTAEVLTSIYYNNGVHEEESHTVVLSSADPHTKAEVSLSFSGDNVLFKKGRLYSVIITEHSLAKQERTKKKKG